MTALPLNHSPQSRVPNQEQKHMRVPRYFPSASDPLMRVPLGLHKELSYPQSSSLLPQHLRLLPGTPSHPRDLSARNLKLSQQVPFPDSEGPAFARDRTTSKDPTQPTPASDHCASST